jgi:hypothetical protein
MTCQKKNRDLRNEISARKVFRGDTGWRLLGTDQDRVGGNLVGGSKPAGAETSAIKNAFTWKGTFSVHTTLGFKIHR